MIIARAWTWTLDPEFNTLAIMWLWLSFATQNLQMPCAYRGSDTKNPLEWQKNQQFMYLLHKGGFKSNQHEKSEDAVVPVLIKTPQSNTKHLEHKERSSGPFFK